jgi:subtilisin family serine protease
MSMSNRPKASQIIYAQAVVRPENGNSLLSTSVIIDSTNVLDFHVESDRMDLVRQKLSDAGFEVNRRVGKMAITIAGNAEIFEREFQTRLEAVERLVIKEEGKRSTGTFINAVDSKPFGEIDVSETVWNQFLVGVAINEPVYYFQSNLPSPTAPSTIYDKEYLSVPDGVTQGVNAHLAHQQGVTGKGIHVVMVDSGWYRHPYFVKHNYNVDVHLANGCSEPTIDLSGHGTGESANLLAIAPDIKLTMVKADMALGGTGKNVNSIGALREAIGLKPDIISCSWGSDERKGEISPYNRVLATTVAEAIRRGIIVVFSAGNGQWGFPGQHPEVISAGGAFMHLDGSLKGKIEASSYASSFVSRMYPNRQVPDVCGLVGQLPHGSYIMLPVPPSCDADRRMALARDGTEESDGWAAFSGTSAAAPQLAGICALMKQVNPNLTPAQAKRILEETARDAVDGSSNPSSSVASATKGVDLATGYGLADANLAVNAAKALTSDGCCDNCASPSSQNFSSTSTISLPQTVSKPMASEFPKLKKNLNQIQWELDKQLQALIDKNAIEDIEINISESSFVSRSHISKSAYYLRQILGECFDESKAENKIVTEEVGEEHISAAEGLLKLGKYSDTAVSFLTSVLVLPFDKFTVKSTVTDQNKLKLFKDLKKAASAALSECSSEINKMSSVGQNASAMMFIDKCCNPDGNGGYVSRCSGIRCLSDGSAVNVG